MGNREVGPGAARAGVGVGGAVSVDNGKAWGKSTQGLLKGVYLPPVVARALASSSARGVLEKKVTACGDNAVDDESARAKEAFARGGETAGEVDRGEKADSENSVGEGGGKSRAIKEVESEREWARGGVDLMKASLITGQPFMKWAYSSRPSLQNLHGNLAAVLASCLV